MTEKTDNNNKKIIKKKYEIYTIDHYATGNSEFIENNKITFTNKKKLIEALLIDKKYHFRIHKNTNYIFWGDLDKYKHNIEKFKELLNDFLITYYGLSFNDIDFKYTKNNKTDGSFHYSIPKWNASTEKLKEIHSNFLKKYKSEFTYETTKNGKTHIASNIDTSIYSEHWFRCPNQSKGDCTGSNNQHIII